ncbi:MAG: AMP-dependent synthetase [Chloroflexi bacterium RBG_13_52_14]|nr:MAG: AMP-dependent synthetase [Chloroflexi bacterium RBG_13_52_14]
MEAKARYYEKPWLKFYPAGVPQTIEIPDKSLPQVFDEIAAKYSGKDAIIFYGNKISYGKLKEEVDRFASALHGLGIGKGDKLAIYLLNSPQYIIAYFGALKAGATITPISPVYTSIEVKHQLEDSGAESIVCQDFLYDNVERAGVKLKNIIITDISDYLPMSKKLVGKSVLGRYGKTEALSPKAIESMGYQPFQKLLKKYPPNPPKIEINAREDIAALPYTGGTTGLPKGAALTHRNLLSCQMQCLAFMPTLEQGKEVIPALLPFYHIYGQVVVMLNGLTMGATLVLFTTPDLDEVLDSMDRYRATTFFSVPTAYQFLKDYDKTSRFNWKNLKIITSGADTLHESTVKDWERRTGSKIQEGYGLTECSAVSHLNPMGRSKIGSFGVPLPNIIAAVVDHETNEFLSPGEIGEMILHGPNIMKGYWKRPEDTQESLIEIDGKIWLKTGDLVRMDDEGYFFFYDRKKDMIKYKGYSVFAREIEEVLHQHPQIKAAGVLGVPDPTVGQLIKAIVVLQPEARGKLSEEEITKYCAENLAHYKVPKIVEFRGELPKTDVGKVSHRELREELEEA